MRQYKFEDSFQVIERSLIKLWMMHVFCLISLVSYVIGFLEQPQVQTLHTKYGNIVGVQDTVDIDGNKQQRAIALSGTVSAWAVDRFNSTSKASKQFAGCDSNNGTEMMTCLRGKQNMK
ncbi:hypothetical protein ACF0H5_016813 [Mactra antiquata]